MKIKRLIKSFIYAARGLVKVFKEEDNFKIDVIVFAGVVILGIFFKIKNWEWLIILLAAGMVFFAELANSAVERVSDALKPRLDDYAKEIKDIMAGAVLVSALSAVSAGLVIFLPKILDLCFK